MEQRREEWDATRQYDETQHPDNPPNSLLSRPTRRRALASYLGPVIVLFLIVGFALMYWSARDATSIERPRAANQEGVGTSGGPTPGGFDPQPKPDSTRDEIERRGGVDDPAQGPSPALRDRSALTSISDVAGKPNDVAGRPVDLKNVEVDSAQGNMFWIRDGGDKVEVVAPSGVSTPQKGAHVHVVGTVEAFGNSTRVRASKVDWE